MVLPLEVQISQYPHLQSPHPHPPTWPRPLPSASSSLSSPTFHTSVRNPFHTQIMPPLPNRTIPEPNARLKKQARSSSMHIHIRQ